MDERGQTMAHCHQTCEIRRATPKLGSLHIRSFASLLKNCTLLPGPVHVQLCQVDVVTLLLFALKLEKRHEQ